MSTSVWFGNTTYAGTLWARDAVGIIGGEPKCGTSFLALDLAVSVAAAVPCLRHFPAAQAGPVVLFAAEDASHIVRRRLEGIARAAATPFERLDIAVIDVPVLRLDHRADRQRLHDTVEHIRPRLLVLDPLVRLHGVDENAVAEIAPILAFLRDLQRRFNTAGSCTMPARAPPHVPAKLFVARPNSMPGATAICTCADERGKSS